MAMNILLVIIGLLGAGYGLLLLWYGLGWKRLPVFSPAAPVSGRTRVTVIIPARDEAQNLPPLLEALQRQTYPAELLEIIVIDDFSADNTEQVVRDFPAANVRLLRLSDHLDREQRLNSFKKKAIEIAVGQATGALIVTTDADCVMGPQWMETLVQYYETHGRKFIAAPVSFYQERNFFKILQSLDFMNMQGITGAVTQLKIGTMCNGANLAYEKAVFYEVGGFSGIDNIASGDDMLLMYKVYRRYPDGIGYLKNEAAIVRTLPVDTLKAFMHQRIRWSSKADKYDDKRLTWMLAVVYLWNAALLLMGIAAVFFPLWWYWLLIFLLFKITVELYFMVPVARFFGKTTFLLWVIPGQLFHIPYIVIAGWLGKFGTYQWKGRTVN
ncbi:cellulose synthase/poly-beta-1,6-N-acetylglucosamine synthase-like glycosyltransferase [Chitinophaga japonensis]|uniref:Cellulose synthase/poly-beta-1,6-N-acetylglucosamine synthase-like glycosyltransferase n=2 Tax=Chitinophaga japonensis TaxID=104662 RepID=A0A562TFG8_CHIJA|nr:cellulose synthase/poly-beta-1,6-N-acetylglucosamine synthase-like glycosyltransferase [Chitinophaga japonensis]